MSGVYQLLADPTTILRLADDAFIPCEGANRDYQEYQAWLAEGIRLTDPPQPDQKRPYLKRAHRQFPHGRLWIRVVGAMAQNLNSVNQLQRNGRFPGKKTVGIF
jgi:hypothetical protein